ncbi:transposon Ty3-I Gag-Pol polyprotein [Trichonephila clavipes]|nr:transposon Ty3-I Gag-Pol polyprotein [Trichonephila clavipes]
MAPRKDDAAVVQKDSLGVDEFLSKLIRLEDQLASLKLQRKVPHHHQRSRNLVKAYYQISIAEEDKEKTAITTPDLVCTSSMNTMSFGLMNAPSSFRRFNTEVLYGLDFGFPYLDDVLVASSLEEEHMMGADQVEYLGFLMTAEGSRPLPEVKAISNYKLPETIHDLRTFLDMINFY